MNNPRPGMLPGFGLHVVEARGRHSSREKADGGLSVEEAEDIFTEQLGNFSDYSTRVNTQAWADHHTAMWSYDGLDSYLKAFKQDGVPYLVGSWEPPTKSGTLWSLLVQNPDTQLVLELQGACESCSKEAGAYAFPESRGTDTRVNSSYTGEHTLHGVHISRAVSNVSEIEAFYKLVFGVSPVWTQSLEGLKITDIDVVSGGVTLRFTERHGQSGEHTTDWFQAVLRNASTFYMTKPDSCWPLWGDNHWGGSNSEDLSGIVSIFKENKLPYHLFDSASWGNKLHGYFYEPSGWQIQLNDAYADPPSAVEDWSGSLCFTSCE